MTREDIKEVYSMRDIVERYGITINRKGFCHCPFHQGDNTPSMKIYAKDYHCHACGANGDIFTFIEDMDNLTFLEVFALLGGTHEQTFSARYKQEQAMKERKKLQAENGRLLSSIKLNLNLIGAYRNRIAKTEPYSEEWCYCQNELVKQIAIYEHLSEKR